MYTYMHFGYHYQSGASNIFKKFDSYIKTCLHELADHDQVHYRLNLMLIRKKD